MKINKAGRLPISEDIVAGKADHHAKDKSSIKAYINQPVPSTRLVKNQIRKDNVIDFIVSQSTLKYKVSD